MITSGTFKGLALSTSILLVGGFLYYRSSGYEVHADPISRVNMDTEINPRQDRVWLEKAYWEKRKKDSVDEAERLRIMVSSKTIVLAEPSFVKSISIKDIIFPYLEKKPPFSSVSLQQISVYQLPPFPFFNLDSMRVVKDSSNSKPQK